MKHKSKDELIKEIKQLKKRLTELERCEISLRELEEKVIRRAVELAKTNVSLQEEIAERQRAEQALRESEHKIRALYDQTFQFIGLMTANGTLIEANRTALEFAGIKREDVLNKPFWKTPWWTHSPKLQEKLRQAVKKVAKGEFVRFEATHRDKQGILHYIDFSLKPVKDESGKVVMMIPEGRDITDQKKKV